MFQKCRIILEGKTQDQCQEKEDWEEVQEVVASQDHQGLIEDGDTQSLDHALIPLIDIEETPKGSYLYMT